MVLRCLFFLTLLWVGLPAHAFPEFYTFSEQAEAKKEAAARNLPLAWLGGRPSDLTDAAPPSQSTAQLEKMVLALLKDRAVVIFFEGANEHALPPVVDRELHIKDDGELPDGHTWYTPKVVFTTADVTEPLGRVSRSQMNQNGEGAVNSAFQIMLNKVRAMQAKAAAAPEPAAEKPAAVPMKSNKEGEVVGSISNAVDFIDLVAQYRLTIIAVGILGAVAFGGFVWWTRRK